VLVVAVVAMEENVGLAREIPLLDIDQRRAHSRYKPKNHETASALPEAETKRVCVCVAADGFC